MNIATKWQNLKLFSPETKFQSNLNALSYAPILFNLLNSLVKMKIWSASLAFYHFFQTTRLKSIKREYQCKILYSCIDIYSYSCLNPLSNERKSMFKSEDSRAVWTWVWTWKYLKWALHYLHDVIRKALRTRLIISPMLLFSKYGYDVVTTLWRSKVYSRRHFVQCKKMDNLMF